MILSLRSLLSAGALLLFPLSLIFAEAEPAPAPEEAAPEEAAPPTVIRSERVEMVTREDETHFVFSDKVSVTGNNLVVHCDRMEVFSSRNSAATERAPEIGAVRLILAIGNVRIEQEGRIGTAGRAELFPIEGRVVLTESPTIRNEHGTVTGHRIILNQGENQAIVESGDEQPAEITLPAIPNLGGAGGRQSKNHERRSN